MGLAPIVLFVYNRFDHTRRTVQALQNNVLAKDSKLIVYADAAKNSEAEGQVIAVRDYLKTIDGFLAVDIRHRYTNLGFNQNIITGVSEVVNEYGKIIVVEDDLVTSQWFLSYMNDALERYEQDNKVACIHGYLLPVKRQLKEAFFLKGADCWGWATWKRAWDLFEDDAAVLLSEIKTLRLQYEFEFNGTYPYVKMLEGEGNGKNASWDVRWYASAFLQNKLTLYPGTSLVNNIGHDNSGSNCGETQTYEVSIGQNKVDVSTAVEVDQEAYAAIAELFRTISSQDARKKSWLSRSFKRFKSTIKHK